jgi:hypothetical protein
MAVCDFPVSKAHLQNPDHWRVKLTDNTLEINVLFPEAYPMTTFRTEKKNPLANLTCFFNTKKDYVFLSTFYVYTRVYNARDEEKCVTRGLGKAMLCYAMKWLVANKRISSDAIIKLEASGGRCDADEIEAAVQRYTETELDVFLKGFPQNLDVDEPMTKKDKAQLLCDYRANQRLVSYYQTFGLHIVPKPVDLWSTSLIGSVRGVLDACQNEHFFGIRPRRSQRLRLQ